MKKWALIVGGSSGIGLATCKKLANHNFNLLIIHRDRRSVIADFEKELSLIRKKTEVHSFNVDATNPNKIEDLMIEISSIIEDRQIELVVHSLSRGNLKPLISVENSNQLSLQDLTLTFESMGSNLLQWVHALKQKNLVAEAFRVVALTSAGSHRYWKSYAAVGTAKSALETMSRYLAIELAPTGARVNVIEAGITDTPSLKMIPGYEDLISWSSRKNPAGRMTQASDIADAIYLLTLPEANWINGAIIKVDGGEHLV